MAPITSRRDAEAADAADELAGMASEFHLPTGVIYLDGNSLGPPSERVLGALRAIQDEWAAALVTGWDRWVELPLRVGDLVGSTLLGAANGQVVVADSTTINLYKAVAASLTLRPGRRAVVVETGSFPTDRYIVQQLGASVREADLDAVPTVLDTDVAVVVLSAVDYRTAALADIQSLTAAAHEVGALIVWDLSHAAGAVPLELDAWHVDFAVGCTYKYLNAGPGSPAYLFVRRELHDVASPIPGWFGHADQFAMEPTYRPADGIARFLTGTPNIPGTVAVSAAVELLRDAGLDRLHRKSAALTDLAIHCADSLPAELGFEVATPRDPRRRGSHLALRHPEADQLSTALLDECIITDYRPPDIIRLGFAPLYTRFVEVWDAFEVIERVGRYR